MEVEERILTKLHRSVLDKPVVILISLDGFRWGYQWKVATPNIDRLISNGTEAFPGMIPVYPSTTFPNHYSIVTGLYPAWHGIIANRFRDPANEKFTTDRVDAVLGYLDRSVVPSFIGLYFEEPDKQGHREGADAPQISAAITRVDSMIGKLLEGLEKRKILEEVTIIVVGDHGSDHGYDNLLGSMRTIFIGHGPQFAKGKKVPSCVNVEVYNVITTILGINGTSNNGTADYDEESRRKKEKCNQQQRYGGKQEKRGITAIRKGWEESSDHWFSFFQIVRSDDQQAKKVLTLRSRSSPALQTWRWPIEVVSTKLPIHLTSADSVLLITRFIGRIRVL
ncbi:hypothetical protein SELMODRAFT_431577 [Selaginella moellendorffii]|uniref:Sulfatase N-terminal domain-containing protein n=1 Tax=Selaginella moellendorffii TaxID=88036 RepID=D8TD39_SELML|nr:hypothetical protein SELMODRAFT_431577 [Selaginella moellendorffii]